MMMADRIAVMEKGRVLQIGSPADLYERPRTQAVARFIGDANVIVPECRARLGDSALIAVAEATFEIASCPPGPFALGLRPEKIRVLDPHAEWPGLVTLDAVIDHVLYRGDVTDIRVRAGDTRLRASVLNATRHAAGALKTGDRVRIAFAPDDVMVLPE